MLVTWQPPVTVLAGRRGGGPESGHGRPQAARRGLPAGPEGDAAASGPISPSVRLPKPDGRRPSPVPASRDRCGTSETEPRPANQCSTSRASGWSSCPSWSPVGEPRCDSLRSMLRGGDAFGPAKSARPSTGWGPGRSLRAGHAASRRRPRGGLLPRVSRPDLGPSQGRVRVTSSRRPAGRAGHQPDPREIRIARPRGTSRFPRPASHGGLTSTSGSPASSPARTPRSPSSRSANRTFPAPAPALIPAACPPRLFIHRYSSQGERGLGFDAGQLGRVADVVDTGDACVLDAGRHDAVDLAVQA